MAETDEDTDSSVIDGRNDMSSPVPQLPVCSTTNVKNTAGFFNA
jgi:hypothetical protein